MWFNTGINVVGPSSLTVRPTVYFVQGPQRVWALESQLHDSRTGLPAQALPVLGSGSVLGIPLVLDWKIGLLYTMTSCVQKDRDAHHEHAAATWY